MNLQRKGKSWTNRNVRVTKDNIISKEDYKLFTNHFNLLYHIVFLGEATIIKLKIYMSTKNPTEGDNIKVRVMSKFWYRSV